MFEEHDVYWVLYMSHNKDESVFDKTSIPKQFLFKLQ
jgi:hypothetical protein